MAIATFDDLRNVARYDNEDRVKIAKSLTGKNLFLSHSQSDLQHAKYAMDLLEQNGARVYIDVRDGSLQDASDIDVAKRLRNAIKECKRLVVLVTENTRTSRWVPWEMGLADAVAGIDHLALLPLRASATAAELWAQQEYFNLYARVERHYSAATGSSWLVRTRDGAYIGLSQWVERSRP
jgi:hypothetical protein